VPDTIDPKYHALMNEFAASITDIFPGCTFVFLICPPEGPAGGRLNYISNGERKQMTTLLKEFLARAEGQPAMKGTA
jgi:hypothetical protein